MSAANRDERPGSARLAPQLPWRGYPFLYPPKAAEAQAVPPLLCQHDPCWCGRASRHSFDPWTPEGHAAFLNRRRKGTP